MADRTISEFADPGATARYIVLLRNNNASGTLQFALSGAGANRDLVDIEAFRERLTLHLENASFAGASASYFSVDNEFYWFSAGLTWADMQTIAVRLTLSVPGIDSITFSDAGTDGTYGIGDAVTATVTFNEAVTVTGTPQLEIDAGGTPETLGYSSGSGTAALVFTGYTVAAGEEDTDGLAVAGNKLTLDGGTIKATAGGNPDAVLDHDAVPASANHRVDGVKPTLVTTGGGAPKPSSDGTKVILTFSEAIGSVDRTRITVKSGTTTLSTTADSMSGATVEITLTTALTSSDTSVTVELAADAVEDLAGNGIAAVAATTVSVEDNTPPTLTGASTVSNDLVQLSYDEALDLTSQPAGSAFTVKVGGRARPVITVSFSGNRHVNLILGSAFRPGDTVTVSYSAPETGPIQDVARNAAASFADETVTNDLAATAPEAPGFLGATPDIISAVPVRLYADRMLLTWTTPWNNGSDIMKFQVRHVEGSTAGGAWTDIDNSDGNTTTHTVTGLTADTDVGADAHRLGRERRHAAHRGRTVSHRDGVNCQRRAVLDRPDCGAGVERPRYKGRPDPRRRWYGHHHHPRGRVERQPGNQRTGAWRFRGTSAPGDAGSHGGT